MVGEPGSLSGFILDQMRRGEASSIASKIPTDNLTPEGQALVDYAKATGDPTALQSASRMSALARLNTANPREMVGQAVTGGMMTPTEGITALSNPMLQMGALSQLNNRQPSPAGTAPNNPPTSAPITSSAPAATEQPKTTGVDTAYLNQVKQMSPQVGTMAENMISGVFNMESGKGENDPVYNMALQVAQKADPTFTPQALIGRPQMIKNSTSGDMYKLETSLNTGMAHLYDLHELAPLTMNSPSSSPLVNRIGKYETLAMGGKPAGNISRYSATLNTAAPEIAKYLGGGAATDTGTEEARSNFSENQAPDFIQQNARDLGAKMMAKGGSLQNEYDITMGSAGTKRIVHPLTEALYKDMQGVPLTPNEQQIVNAHRIESNLPPKTWGKDKTVLKPVSAPIPEQKEQKPQEKPQITPEMARAELARRRATK